MSANQLRKHPLLDSTFLCLIGYKKETWSYLRGEKKNPSLAPDSRPFQKKSSLIVVPLYFLGLLVLVDRVVYCLMKKEEARILHEAVPHASLCSPGVDSFYK